MPDANGDPTDPELIAALGWGDADETVEPSTPTIETPTPSGLLGPDGQSLPTTQPPLPTVLPTPSAAPQPTDLQQQVNQQTEQLRQQQVISQINQAAGEYMQQQISSGTDEYAARQMAVQYAQTQHSNYQANRAMAMAESQAKQSKARELASTHGVDYNQLMNYNDVPSMEQAAGLLARMTAIEKQSVPNATPVQTFDSNSSGQVRSRESQKLDYATGRGDLTDEQFHDLFDR